MSEAMLKLNPYLKKDLKDKTKNRRFEANFDV
jgi:hypothetical protein